MTLYLPDDKEAHLKGIVRRATKTNSYIVKNGMGVELMEYDENYLEFLKTILDGDLKAEPLIFEEPATTASDAPSEDKPDSQILKCPHCGVKNRVPHSKLSMDPKCGKCKKLLTE
jgi:hypothetical protein